MASRPGNKALKRLNRRNNHEVPRRFREFEICDDFYGHEVSGEEEKNLGAAITELGDDFRWITAADALSAVIKREVRDDQFRDGVRFILELFEEEANRRGLSDEEKKKLTLGDLLSGGDEDDEEEDQ
jgi:hypothetical protein